ncbi:Hypothetical protein RG1141_PA02250 (plasmid) [Neorhizobium galegae bv. officinalis bv. officinalis str. HAMBI 1141]|uniref:Uncharacterized protein n=2 Tax=Neorhizobium galegae TaxID=399 RepID=A0A068THS7_NEOGA|nr:Hypothetical protein RG1141_PA02250 [Neorhizobium galegae bv. officinalis bv. officinalis str. HAMBI 1141]
MESIPTSAHCAASDPELVTAFRSANRERPMQKLFLSCAGITKCAFNQPEGLTIWRLEHADGQLIATNENAPPNIQNCNPNASLYLAIDAAKLHIADRADVMLFFPQDELLHVYNGDIASRIRGGYRKTDKKPYAHADAIRTIDKSLDPRGIELLARKPESKEEFESLYRVQDAARRIYAEETERRLER